MSCAWRTIRPGSASARPRGQCRISRNPMGVPERRCGLALDEGKRRSSVVSWVGDYAEEKDIGY